MSDVKKLRDVRSTDAPQNRKQRERVRVKAEKDRAKSEEKRAKDVKAVLDHDANRDPPSGTAGAVVRGSVG